MAKKRKQEKETNITNYYDLNTDKMDELVKALKGETPEDAPEVSMNMSDCTGEEPVLDKKGREEKFDPYKIDKFSRIPAWLKAIFIKFWFAGAVCYFVNMGLGVYIPSPENLMLLDGLVYAILTDFIINPIFRMIQSDEREMDWYIMFPFPAKKLWTIFANILYYVFVFWVVSWIYALINGVLQIGLYIEPLLFGVFALIVDMAAIGLKDLVVWLVLRHKKKKEDDENV